MRPQLASRPSDLPKEQLANLETTTAAETAKLAEEHAEALKVGSKFSLLVLKGDRWQARSPQGLKKRLRSSCTRSKR